MAWVLGVSSMAYVFYFFAQRRDADMGLLLCSASMISFLSSVCAAMIGIQGGYSILTHLLIFSANAILSAFLILYFSIRAVGVNKSVFRKDVDLSPVVFFVIIGAGIAVIFSLFLENGIPYCTSAKCLFLLKLMAMDYDTLLLYAFSLFPVLFIQGVVARVCASLMQTNTP